MTLQILFLLSQLKGLQHKMSHNGYMKFGVRWKCLMVQ